ncbi:hypothetical protein DFJ74DRAFT_685497 [Hyaloraphidium curvatum]|nr:hypothetical protein DFJ74DRAFT_685497 [Hyaloraphidium curvatum]
MATRRLALLLLALFALVAVFAGAATAAPTDKVHVVKRSSCAECVEGERCKLRDGRTGLPGGSHGHPPVGVGAVDGMVSCIYEAENKLDRRAPPV